VTAPVFVVDAAALIATPGRVRLEGPEGHHAAAVRRLRPGERVDVTDGAGRVAECVVTAVGRDVLELAVRDLRALPAPAPRLVVVQALVKGDRSELAVELMSEVGVDVVVPWQAARCVVRWSEDRAGRGLARWRASAREAAKQARRGWFPEVRDLAGADEVVSLLRAAALPVVLDAEAGRPLAGVPTPPAGDVVVVVGPEGGLTPAELAAFAAAGAPAYALGPTVLRSSTAGSVAAAVLLAGSARWS
jgi:16S rRNA (uracil1498-N3)-methyltransferase